MCYNVAVNSGEYYFFRRYNNLERNAYIEINNYTAKLIIAEVQKNSFFNVVSRRVVPIELGKDFDKDF